MKNSAERLKQIIDVLKKYHIPKEMTPENLRLAFEELGPTFIKMGQIMASREDLIPKNYCDELSNLRSSVRPMPFDEVVKIIEEEYQCNISEVFSEFDGSPIGSASIAQVHKAKLLDGTVVAVKVQRRNIEKLMRTDMGLLKKAISILCLNKITGDIIDLEAVVDEMYARTLEEMDFNIELSHVKEFNKNNKDLVYIKTPNVYEELSYNDVLVMEYVDGYRITDSEKLKRDGYDLDEIGEKLAHNYLKQAIDDGFYHADPHSDNIKISGGKIVYLDFGMMGRLSKGNRELLEQCIQGIVKNDISLVARILVMFDTKKDTVDYMKLKNDIKMLLDKHKVQGIASIDIKEFMSGLFSLLQSNAITLPKEITMLARGIVVLEGTLEDIDPEINLIEVLEKRFNYKDIFNENKIKNFFIDGVKSSTDMVMIPNELLTTLKGINTGELRFNIELTDSKNQVDRIERLVNLCIVTVLDVALILGTSHIMVNVSELPLIFYVYLIGSIICTVWLIYKMIISKFRRF